MAKVVVAYWSGTGNTERMAEIIGNGVKAAGKEAEVVSMDAISAADLKDVPAFALGCPSMGDEELEDSVAEGFVAEVESFAAGKSIGLFGSYGWGDGQWMRDWTERMKNAGATVIGDGGVICCGEPDGDAEVTLEELGKALAALV